MLLIFTVSIGDANWAAVVLAVLWICHFSLCFSQLQGPPGVSGFPGNPGLPVRMKYICFFKEHQTYSHDI